MSRHTPKPGVGDLFGDDSDDDQPQHAEKPRAEPSNPANSIDPQVQEVADKLAEFCAKNGRHYEDLTRDRNPGNTPFKFLWNKSSKEYKYYEDKLNSLLHAAGPGSQPAVAERQYANNRQDSHKYSSSSSYPPAPSVQEQQASQRGGQYTDYRHHSSSGHSSRHDSNERDRYHSRECQYSARDQHSSGERDRYNSSELGHHDYRSTGGHPSREGRERYNSSSDRNHDDRQPRSSGAIAGGDSSREPGRKRTRWETGSAADQPASAAAAAAAPAGGRTQTLSAMEEYMRKLDEAAKQRQRDEEEEEERRKRAAMPLLKETAFDRRKVVAVFKDDGQRGHHMDDFIPKEELAKFMAKCGDTKLQQQVEAQSAIGADNIGHKLLQKMGWKEGKGIGAKEHGQTAPVAAAAAGMAQDKLGLGAQAHGAVEESDDPFEQYRKRMMLGYKYRPNPLGNPRRPYY